MHDLVTFGEAMIRLSPPAHQRLEQCTSLDVNVGGAEFNAAAAASRLGLKTAWVSRLPDTAIGRLIRDRAGQHGVDTSAVLWEEDGRAGLYFCELGAAPRPSSVLYDRANSSVSRIGPGMVDWPALLGGATWFHVSGITPALSASAAAVTTEALDAAKDGGCHTSYDLNYRARLWSEADARAFTESAMMQVDTLITTEEDTKRVFGIEANTYQEVATALRERFDLRAVAITLRETPSVWRNRWTAVVCADGRVHETRTYEVEVVDRVGCGDAFCGGYIFGMLNKGDLQYALDLGVAYSAIKHSVPGDVNFATLEEAKRLMSGGGLRIRR